MKNALHLLQDQGQSVWLDFLGRDLITSGQLARLIQNDGLSGLTSNPSIFEKAFAAGSDYRDLLEAPDSQGLDPKELYERIAVRDIRAAADLLEPVYLKSRRRDGYVSLEVSPWLARDTQGTLLEARRLWHAVGRANLMIKVPGTPEGIPAVQQLVAEGINVNVTLLFAQETYEQAAAAYLSGLESLAATRPDLGGVASVASFFISRIDTAVDNWIAERLRNCRKPSDRARLRSLLGKVANASARRAYQQYTSIFQGERWEGLLRQGAQTQRLLWASTGQKNPNYLDVLYVEELIGPDTVNTMPLKTLDAFRDHGQVRASLLEGVPEATRIIDLALELGVPFKALTDRLLYVGVKQFAEAFANLLRATDRRPGTARLDGIDFQQLELLKGVYEGQHHS